MLKSVLLGAVALVALGANATASFAQEMPKELRVGISAARTKPTV